jgi:hypothetical protein
VLEFNYYWNWCCVVPKNKNANPWKGFAPEKEGLVSGRGWRYQAIAKVLLGFPLRRLHSVDPYSR